MAILLIDGTKSRECDRNGTNAIKARSRDVIMEWTLVSFVEVSPLYATKVLFCVTIRDSCRLTDLYVAETCSSSPYRRFLIFRQFALIDDEFAEFRLLTQL